MTDPEFRAQTIQVAADLIRDEAAKSGSIISEAIALRIAKQLHDVWQRPGGVLRHIPAGEIAQKFRDRYEEKLSEVAAAMIEKPLVDYRGLPPNAVCTDCGDRKPCDNKCPLSFSGENLGA